MNEPLNILQDFPTHTYDEWYAAAEKLLKGKPFERTLIKKTYEGIDIKPIYFEQDLDKLAHIESLPGQPNYVRGNSPTGATTRAWGIAQEITNAAPADFNAAAKNDLSRGQNILNMVLDKAAGKGEDPGELTGVGGVSIANGKDMETALADIDLATTPIMLQCGFSGISAISILVEAAKKQDADLQRLEGCIVSDPVGYLAMEGALPISIDKAYDEMAQLTLWAKENAAKLKTIAVTVHPYQFSGCNAFQEIGYALATGVEHIQALLERGLVIDEIAPRMIFSFSIGADFFMEIAKFRAARMLWQQVVSSFGGNENSCKMYIHARTSTWNKTHVDPWVNMLRVSTEAFSAIAGSVESLHVGPFDEVFRRPNEFSRRIARNVQIVLKDEGHFGRVIDPAGGSWYVETITSQLAEKAWKHFQDLEAEDGILAALKKGIPQQQAAEIAVQRAKNIATRKDRIVGTNMYPNLDEKKEKTDSFDYAAFQQTRKKEVAESKKDASCNDALARIKKTQKEIGAAVVSAAIEAASAGATLGEISAALRADATGDESVTPLNIHRGAIPFEQLRRATEAWTEKNGKAPQIFMINMGPIPKHKARADFSTSFLNVGAFDTIPSTGFSSVDEAAEAALSSGAKAAVICATDADYPEIVPPMLAKIKAAQPNMFIILAGYPKEYIESFKEAGIDEFLHIRANALDLLEKLQKHLGVIA